VEKKKFFKEYVEPIVIAILIALFIRAFIVQAFKIPSSSMEDTLLVGDHILVNKFIYGIRIPYTNIKFFQ
jgi:signal peptidase I